MSSSSLMGGCSRIKPNGGLTCGSASPYIYGCGGQTRRPVARGRVTAEPKARLAAYPDAKFASTRDPKNHGHEIAAWAFDTTARQGCRQKGPGHGCHRHAQEDWTQYESRGERPGQAPVARRGRS